MNNKVKIGVIEDEAIIAELICITLSKLGYDVAGPANSYKTAIKMLETEEPDLVLVDIQLLGGKSGIEVAETINNQFKIPFIFLTAYTDKDTLEKAKKVNPPAYLVKPFNNEELFCAIEICLSNYNTARNERASTGGNYLVNDTVFIKDGYHFYKIKYDDIYYIESDHVYVNVFTASKKLTIRSSLGNFIASLNNENFLRLHRSYAVNTQYIETINIDNVVVKGVKIPTTKTYREELLTKLKIL